MSKKGAGCCWSWCDVEEGSWLLLWSNVEER